jgi:hypothetical protein
MNFARLLVLELANRNSGRQCRSAVATTSSDGATSGRIVRSQDPIELQGQALFRSNRDIGTTWTAVLKITQSTTKKPIGFRK